MTEGIFLSIEGGEGVGKSTQIAALCAYLKEFGKDVVLTREPGGTDGAEAIRSLLLNGSADRWQPRAEALLFAAARSDHVAKLIQPALIKGQWVISDRYIDSSRAYQANMAQNNGLGLTDADILQLHNIGSNGFLPHRTIILDLPDAEAAERAHKRDGGASDRIGGRDSDFHRAVRAAFHSFALQEPARVRLIDASGSPDAVTGRIIAAIEDLL